MISRPEASSSIVDASGVADGSGVVPVEPPLVESSGKFVVPYDIPCRTTCDPAVVVRVADVIGWETETPKILVLEERLKLSPSESDKIYPLAAGVLVNENNNAVSPPAGVVATNWAAESLPL